MIKYGTDLIEYYRRNVYSKKMTSKDAIKELNRKGIEISMEDFLA